MEPTRTQLFFQTSITTLNWILATPNFIKTKFINIKSQLVITSIMSTAMGAFFNYLSWNEDILIFKTIFLITSILLLLISIPFWGLVNEYCNPQVRHNIKTFYTSNNNGKTKLNSKIRQQLINSTEEKSKNESKFSEKKDHNNINNYTTNNIISYHIKNKTLNQQITNKTTNNTFSCNHYVNNNFSQMNFKSKIEEPGNNNPNSCNPKQNNGCDKKESKDLFDPIKYNNRPIIKTGPGNIGLIYFAIKYWLIQDFYTEEKIANKYLSLEDFYTKIGKLENIHRGSFKNHYNKVYNEIKKDDLNVQQRKVILLLYNNNEFHNYPLVENYINNIQNI